MNEHILWNAIKELKNKTKDDLNNTTLFELEKIYEKNFDPLFIENKKRFVMYPIEYDNIWKMYKKHQSTYWIAEEIDLSKDTNHWKQLNDNERYFLKYILAFFASFDGIVNENLIEQFFSEIQLSEARSFYCMQINMENIHSETYSLLIEHFAESEVEKLQLLNVLGDIKQYKSIQKMAEWAQSWASSDRPFNQRIVVFTFIEGVWFSGPFASIFYFKKRGLLPGLTFSNELISRDEGLHMDFGVELHKLLKIKAHENIIHDIAKNIVNFSIEFTTESLPCNLIGMNSSEMIKYIKYVADRLLTQLDCKKIWNETNPFSWMDLISTEVKTNFFERKPGNYSKAKVCETVDDSSEILDDY